MADVQRGTVQSRDVPSQAAPEASSGNKPLGELFGDLTGGLSNLVHKEIQLAKLEMTKKLGASIKGVVFLIIAGVFGLVGFLALVAMAILALAQIFVPWLAALIVAFGLLLVAGICALLGISTLKKNSDIVPHQTVETLKEDVQWLKTKVK